jgi:hypothetical protein
MKTVIALLLGIVSTNIAAAQWELYGARSAGDTVKIWNTNIYVSCYAKFTASVTVSNDSIIVTEQDTSTHHALCSCFYDVNVALTSLTPGTYQCVIRRVQLTKYQYGKDTTILAASFTFSVSGAGGPLPSAKVQTSDCHQTPLSVMESAAPSSFALLASYPNPFNPIATLRYSIPQNAPVKLEVFDALGRIVSTLVDEKKNAGEYHVQFDGTALASGTYLCRLTAGTIVLSNKLVLLK